MNNSGETETFKYSGYSSQLIPGSGTNSFRTPNVTASGTNSVGIGGFTAPRTLVVSGNDAIGIGSTDGSQPLPDDMIMIGHRTSQQASTRGVVVGTASQIYSNGVVVGSDCSSQSESIIVGNSSRGFGYRNINIGHSITFNTGTESIAIGSAKNILNVGDYEIIFGGQSTTMTGTGNHQSLIGGHSNTIGGTTSYSTILGGKDNTITGGTYQVMVGTSGRTALYNNTVHVDNSHTFLTESFNTINIGNVGGNINVNCSLGTIFLFTMTANTTPNFINLREGQRIIFSIINNGSFTVPTATVDGVPTVVLAKGGTVNPTNNGITLYYATWMVGNLYLDQHLNFQPI
jgi:hypothetical protein